MCTLKSVIHRKSGRVALCTLRGTGGDGIMTVRESAGGVEDGDGTDPSRVGTGNRNRHLAGLLQRQGLLVGTGQQDGEATARRFPNGSGRRLRVLFVERDGPGGAYGPATVRAPYRNDVHSPKRAFDGRRICQMERMARCAGKAPCGVDAGAGRRCIAKGTANAHQPTGPGRSRVHEPSQALGASGVSSRDTCAGANLRARRLELF